MNSSNTGRTTTVSSYRHLDVISAVFVAVLLISQTTASKIAAFGPFTFSAGIVLFPISYIFGDILTEVYGYERSRRVIWLGFFASALMALIYAVVGVLPASPDWLNQEAYDKILGVVPRVALGSLLAYFAGEFINSYILAKMKVRTRGRWLWARTIGSTIVGEAVDTAVVMTVAFYGILPTSTLVTVAINIYIAKVLYEIAATPLTYAIVGFLKRAEGVDAYDEHTDFNPFQFADSRRVPPPK